MCGNSFHKPLLLLIIIITTFITRYNNGPTSPSLIKLKVVIILPTHSIITVLPDVDVWRQRSKMFLYDLQESPLSMALTPLMR